ncbi:MAG: hypothetical protein ACXW32_07435 [Limisphaerales bacterium]
MGQTSLHALSVKVLDLLRGLLELIFGSSLSAMVRSQNIENQAATLRFAERILDLGIFAILVWLFYRGTELIRVRLELWAKKSATKIDDLIIPTLIKTLWVVLPLVAITLGLNLAAQGSGGSDPEPDGAGCHRAAGTSARIGPHGGSQIGSGKACQKWHKSRLKKKFGFAVQTRYHGPFVVVQTGDVAVHGWDRMAHSGRVEAWELSAERKGERSGK